MNRAAIIICALAIVFGGLPASALAQDDITFINPRVIKPSSGVQYVIIHTNVECNECGLYVDNMVVNFVTEAEDQCDCIGVKPHRLGIDNRNNMYVMIEVANLTPCLCTAEYYITGQCISDEEITCPQEPNDIDFFGVVEVTVK